MCAGGLVYGQVAPACYGIDIVKLVKYASQAIQAMVSDQKMSQERDVKQWYVMSINEMLSHKMGLHIPPSLRMALTYGMTPVDHEQALSSGMNAEVFDKAEYSDAE